MNVKLKNQIIEPDVRRRIRLLGLVLVVGFLAFHWPAFSQTAPIFTLQASPELPFSGDKITVSVSALNFNAASTTFDWFRDGIKLTAASGIGRSSINIATDPSQQEIIQIKVEANPGAGFSRGEQSTVIYTLPSPAQQAEVISGLSSDFTLEASNINPDANESVSVNVITFAFDKNSANYQWYVNGILQREQSGRGKYRFDLGSGPEGSTKTVSVDVAAPSGDIRSKSVTIQTVSAPLYWWADTTVPYWYKGKALPSLNSRVTVMALPAVANSSGLNYRWEFNGGLIPQSSGVGKSTFSFTFNFPIGEQIDVTIKNTLGNFSKTSGIAIEPVLPSVGIYELKPLRGLAYEKRLSEFSAPSGDPYDFAAVPFFFPREREKNLNYLWRLNENEIAGAPPDPWHFILTSKPNVPAFDRLSINVLDPANKNEAASSQLVINLR